MCKTIYFVSVIRSLDVEVTSTYIMTSSLLEGIKKSGNKLVFFAICEYSSEMDKITAYYSDVADKVIALPSRFHYRNKFKQMLALLYHSVFIDFYKTAIMDVLGIDDSSPDLIISHSPSYESVCYGRVLKSIYKNTPYYQYWSDPIALSGITPEAFGVKRIPFKWIEHKAIQSCDRIIYGTKTLMQFQKELFPDVSQNMRYVDVSFVDEKQNNSGKPHCHKLLYAGNYFSSFRNLKPLVDAVSQMPDYSLDVYGSGDFIDVKACNIRFVGRVSREKLSEIEPEYDCYVCIMNHSCIQIPGKLFYDMNKPAKIIVVLDGKYRTVFRDYLESYSRFIFCDNSVEDLKRTINTIDSYTIDYDWLKSKFSPEKIALDLINGGLME